MEEYSKIQLLQSEIEGLAGKPEEDVRRALTSNPLLDSQRMQSVLRFHKHGFTAACSEAGITDRLEAVEEVREFWLTKAEAVLKSLGGAAVLPSPVAVVEDDPASYKRYAKLTTRVVECVYVAAQCKTELAARGRRSWSELGRLLCEEEIARLRWEIFKSGYEPTVRVGETKGEGTMTTSSNEKKLCWFCNLGADQLCLKPQLVEHGPVSVRYTCQGHRLLPLHISGSLVRGIASLLNRGRNRKG